MDDEQARLSALHRYKILDTSPETSFDDLAGLATEMFKLPICVISFTAHDEVYYKANIGFQGRGFEPRKNSMCGQPVRPGEVVVLADIKGHADFFYNLHDIKFFAAAPLVSPDGHSIGNFVVMDSNPVSFSIERQNLLRKLAQMTIDLLEFRLAKSENDSLSQENKSLTILNKKIADQNTLLSSYQEQVVQANAVLEGVLDSYELLFKSAPVAIGICSYNEKVIWQANDALMDIFGEGSVLLGANLENLIIQINGKVASAALDLVGFNSSSYHARDAKLQIKHADGKRNIFVNLSLQLVGRMGDESQNIMFILADVTEQVILKQITQEANVVLMNAIEDTGMGYTIVEFETGIMISNDQLKANYGYTRAEQFNYPDIFNAMLPEYRQVIKQAVSHAIMTKGIYQAEYEVKWRDGSIHRIRAYGKPMYDADGKATHIIGLNKIIAG